MGSQKSAPASACAAQVVVIRSIVRSAKEARRQRSEGAIVDQRDARFEIVDRDDGVMLR